jgi:hypothetical protein
MRISHRLSDWKCGPCDLCMALITLLPECIRFVEGMLRCRACVGWLVAHACTAMFATMVRMVVMSDIMRFPAHENIYFSICIYFYIYIYIYV